MIVKWLKCFCLEFFYVEVFYDIFWWYINEVENLQFVYIIRLLSVIILLTLASHFREGDRRKNLKGYRNKNYISSYFILDFWLSPSSGVSDSLTWSLVWQEHIYISYFYIYFYYCQKYSSKYIQGTDP